jgi:hypothetical protein
MLKTLINPLWRSVGTGLGGGCLVGAVIWIGTLLYQSYKARDIMTTTGPDHPVAIGPLTLHTFSQQATEHGSVVTITFEPGLPVLILLCATGGLMAALLWHRVAPPARSDSTG